MVFGRRRWPRFQPKVNYHFLAHLQCSLLFACKFIPWYLHSVDKLTSKKYAKKINHLWTGKKNFGKYQAQGVNPNPLAYALGTHSLVIKRLLAADNNSYRILQYSPSSQRVHPSEVICFVRIFDALIGHTCVSSKMRIFIQLFDPLDSIVQCFSQMPFFPPLYIALLYDADRLQYCWRFVSLFVPI